MTPFTSRRRIVFGSTAALIALPALAQSLARPTPAQTEGPFYPVALPADSDADLLANGALRYGQGEPALVAGTLVDTQGRPLAGATVEIWQCDHAGRYHHPGDGDRADRAFQGFGKVVADPQGRWRFRTIKPVAYSGRAPHIHVKIRQGQRELLTTQLYVDGDAGNARDGIWRRLSAEDRAAVTAPYVAGADGALAARYAIVVPA